MPSLDIPEVLILLGVLAGVVWGIYNWTHPHYPSPRR